MKAIIRQIFTAAVCSAVFSGLLAAQELFPSQPQKEKTCAVRPFYAVSVGDSFEVTLEEGPCSVKLNTDAALQPYITVSVRDSILYIDYDQKAVPSDIKRIYRGTNAPTPILRATVSAQAWKMPGSKETGPFSPTGWSSISPTKPPYGISSWMLSTPR